MMPISEQTLKRHGFTKTNEYADSEWWEKDNITLVVDESDVFFGHSDFTLFDEEELLRVRGIVDEMKLEDGVPLKKEYAIQMTLFDMLEDMKRADKEAKE